MTTSTTTQQSEEIIDVAIIGGGVAGAYTAYRLTTTQSPDLPENPDIRLFEMSDRIGGRLWSIDSKSIISDDRKMFIELGGMSFSRLQCNIYGLCERELELPIERAGESYANEYLQYFRGQHYWASDYKENPAQVPFHLKKGEQGKYPGALLGSFFQFVQGFSNNANSDYKTFGEVIFEINKRLKKVPYHQDKPDEYLNGVFLILDDLIDFLDNSEFRGTNLYEQGFENVITDILSDDADNLIKYVSDLHSIRGNWNLLNHSFLAMRSQLFRNTYYYTLKNGYNELPQKLVEHIELEMNTKLSNLKPSHNGEEQVIELTFENREPLYARNVVLALPQYALKQLPNYRSIFGNNFNLLDQVTATPVYKLILVYEKKEGKNWWQDKEYQSQKIGKTGFSLTDLNLQGCYYLGDSFTKHSLVIASLGDTLGNQRYWSAYRDSQKEYQIDVKSRLVQEAQRQLEILHDRQVPSPVRALFWDWTDAPFGGGWHLWKSGVRSKEIAKKIRHPNDNLKVFICGEAYSQQQGWVEGAINSAEMMLREHFGFAQKNAQGKEVLRPTWVPDKYRFDW